VIPDWLNKAISTEVSVIEDDTVINGSAYSLMKISTPMLVEIR
jgi:hypothetical protein